MRVNILKLLSSVFVLGAASACASGGAGPSGANAPQVYAAYSGTWSLDASGSSAQVPNPLEGVADNTNDEGLVSRPGGLRYERIIRRMRSRQRDIPATRAMFEVLRERPETLTLRMDATGLVYRAVPGENVTIPMDGETVRRNEGEHPVDAKIVWEGPLLVIEYRVPRGGLVRETIEVVGDRLLMRRNVAGAGEQATLLLAYDRAG